MLTTSTSVLMNIDKHQRAPSFPMALVLVVELGTWRTDPKSSSAKTSVTYFQHPSALCHPVIYAAIATRRCNRAKHRRPSPLLYFVCHYNL